ncbi:MAG: type II toxin-antitoxin system RelE family toxin [Candidatus Aenigmatarchaeota archaeon]
MTYQVEIKEPAEKKLKKLDKSKSEEILNQIDKLKKYPQKYGKPLGGRLSGFWQLRSGKYRIWYTIENKVVYVRAVKHKEEAEEYY